MPCGSFGPIAMSVGISATAYIYYGNSFEVAAVDIQLLEPTAVEWSMRNLCLTKLCRIRHVGTRKSPPFCNSFPRFYGLAIWGRFGTAVVNKGEIEKLPGVKAVDPNSMKREA